MTLTGRPVQNVEPGSPEWLTRMSASKVAAVLGLSPYDSPYSLWHRMAGLLPPEPSTPATARGHYLEPGILAWFRDQHPDWQVDTTGCWEHAEQPRYTATPDALATTPDDIVGVEVKTASDNDEWGKAGTDEIPVGYRAQVVWQMFVVGTRRTHIACLSAYLELREYVVEYDEAEAAFIEQQCRAFLDSLPGGPAEQVPNLDAHSSTYEAVKQLHPAIESRDVDLPPEVVAAFCDAQHRLKAAEEAERLARTVVASHLGDAHRGLHLGKTIATRQSKGGGVPYVVAGRNLPTFDFLQESA